MLRPSLNLLAMVGILHTLAHHSHVATVSRKCYTLTKIQPEAIGAFWRIILLVSILAYLNAASVF